MARNAFRVGLREETPLPIGHSTQSRRPARGAGVTQELDPGDILEVQDMAEAIARAEQLVRTPPPRSSAPVSAPGNGSDSAPDMFENLGRRSPQATRARTTRTTDDTAGPASPAPPYVAAGPTPVPPSSTTMTSAAVTPTPVPRYVTMPSAPEDDAFFHPIGRMRSLADATLDGYRPEPTLLVRAASRRKRFSWIFVAALLPLLVLAAIAIFTSTDTASASPSASPIPTAPREPSVTARGKTPLATTSVAAKSGISAAPQSEPATAATPAGSATPVFDVKSLPSAGAIRTKR